MVETGLCRAKNAAHTMSMNLMIYALGCLGFWAYGFALGWGNWATGRWHTRLELVARARRRRTRQRLGAWRRHRRGYRRRHRRLQLRPDRSEGLFPGRTGRRRRAGPVLLHDGADELRGHHPHRRHGRTLAVEELLPVRTVGGPALRHLRQLGLGRRLAGPGRRQLGPGPRSGRFRRLGRRSRPGRNHRPGRRHGPRPAHRQSTPPEGKPLPIPAHHVPMVVVGTLILAFGWFGFTSGAAPGRAAICASARSRSTRCWPAWPARWPPC